MLLLVAGFVAAEQGNSDVNAGCKETDVEGIFACIPSENINTYDNSASWATDDPKKTNAKLEQIKERLRERIKERVKEDVQNKLIAMKELAITRENFLEAKNKYAAAKKEFVALRENKPVLAILNTDKGLDLAKRFLEHHLENTIIKVERIKDFISKQPQYENNKEEIIAQLDEYSSMLIELKDDVSELQDSNAVMSMVTDIREIWKDAHQFMVQKSQYVVANKIDYALMHFDNMFSKIDARLSAMKDAGKDTTELEASYSDVQAKYFDAKEKLKEAKSKSQIASEDENNLTEGQTLLKDGLEKLKEVNKDLKELIKSIIEMSKE